ncbi:nucleotidyltransferase family protein [Virgibacillus siamensis]|uniref:nucleotidyltransferase family protein n=1 Tax=Virgibacillus siamensis TaxID=480071 RepID=UPI00318312B7
MQGKKDVIQLIYKDKQMLEILKTAKSLDLPDWCICAGFVRSKIWDALHRYEERTPLTDVDVVYFDKTNLNETVEKQLENELSHQMPNIPWSVKNQARMHLINDLEAYVNTEDAIAKFPETATALGVKLVQDNQLKLIAPHGVQDVLDMVVRPTPLFAGSHKLMKVFKKRTKEKEWQSKWWKVSVQA